MMRIHIGKSSDQRRLYALRHVKTGVLKNCYYDDAYGLVRSGAWLDASLYEPLEKTLSNFIDDSASEAAEAESLTKKDVIKTPKKKRRSVKDAAKPKNSKRHNK